MNGTQQPKLRSCPAIEWRSSLSALVVVTALVAVCAACSGETTSTGSASTNDPWGANTVTPAALVQELASASGADRPVVVCTGLAVLYRSGHIPGAVFHGPAASSEGLNDLARWAKTLQQAANVVIYCGCCPVNDCPNIRPAYTTLKALGLTRVRVLLLPDNFGTDWAGRGYPVEK